MDDENDGATEMLIMNLSQFDDDDRVTVKAMVKDPEVVNTGKTKQDVLYS